MDRLRNIPVKELLKRVPFITSAVIVGSMAIDLARPAIADAAGPACHGQEGTFGAYGMYVPFLDQTGRQNIFDKTSPQIAGDPWLEEPALGGEMVVKTPDGRRVSANFTPVPPTVPNFNIPERNLKVGWALLQWTDKCNGDMTLPDGRTIPALIGAQITNSQDEGNATFTPDIAMGGLTPVWFGRRYRRAEDFIAEVDLHPERVRDLSPETLAKLRAQIKQAVANPSTLGQVSLQGPKGDQGPQGERGPQGELPWWSWLLIGLGGIGGALGAASFIFRRLGPEGPVGPQGPQGMPGAQGPKGDQDEQDS